ncbi:MAG: hypothetical protein ACLR2E_23620 [Lachnospiraceae bacterium]
MLYFETEIGKNCGFTIEAEGVSGRLAYLVLSGSGGKQIYPVNLNPARILKHKMEKYMKRGMDYWRIHGMQALTARVARSSFQLLKKRTWIIRSGFSVTSQGRESWSASGTQRFLICRNSA